MVKHHSEGRCQSRKTGYEKKEMPTSAWYHHETRANRRFGAYSTALLATDLPTNSPDGANILTVREECTLSPKIPCYTHCSSCSVTVYGVVTPLNYRFIIVFVCLP